MGIFTPSDSWRSCGSRIFYFSNTAPSYPLYKLRGVLYAVSPYLIFVEFKLSQSRQIFEPVGHQLSYQYFLSFSLKMMPKRLSIKISTVSEQILLVAIFAHVGTEITPEKF